MAIPPWRARLDGLGLDAETKAKALRLILSKPEGDRELWVDHDPVTARDLIAAEIAGKLEIGSMTRCGPSMHSPSSIFHTLLVWMDLAPSLLPHCLRWFSRQPCIFHGRVTALPRLHAPVSVLLGCMGLVPCHPLLNRDP